MINNLLNELKNRNRGSYYMSSHVLLNLLNELGEMEDKMGGLPSILSLFGNDFNKFNKT